MERPEFERLNRDGSGDWEPVKYHEAVIKLQTHYDDLPGIVDYMKEGAMVRTPGYFYRIRKRPADQAEKLRQKVAEKSNS